MGFFNPIAYFIRQFFRYLRSITGKLFIIFVLLFCVLILYMCIDKGVFAATYNPERSLGKYGYYIGFSDSDIAYLDNIIDTYKADYDSFACRAYYISPNYVYTCSFYNFSDLGRAYARSNINSTYRHYYQLYSEYTVSNALHNYNINSSFQVTKNDFSNNLNVLAFSTYNYSVTNSYCIYTNRNVYTDNTFSNLFFESTNQSIGYVEPYIENESLTINNWSFDYLNINSGSVGYVYVDPLLNQTKYSTLYLKYKYKGITYTQPISSAYIPTWSTDNFTLEIPRTLLLNSVNIENGESVEFYLEVKQDNIGDTIYSLGSYTFSLTTEEQEQIQQDSDKAVQGEILQTQQETNNKLDSVENSITSDNVDDMSSDFGSLGNGMTAEDNTGIDTIFQKLYDAFCNNEIQPVSLTIPFVNKSFTIDSNSVSSNFPPAVKSIVAVFVWGVIGLWVLKDIRSIIDKISEGSPEDVGSDVKKEVL